MNKPITLVTIEFFVSNKQPINVYITTVLQLKIV